MTQSKSIGILGLGSRTTAFYIEEINRQYNALFGGDSTCPFTLLNTDFNKINPYLPDDFEPLEKVMRNYMQQLIDLDVGSIVVPNITLYQTLDRMKDFRSPAVPIVHAIERTVDNLIRDRRHSVVLFGSMYTMNAAYITPVFNTQHITVQKPSKEDMELTDMLRKSIYAGNESDKLSAEFNAMIKIYAQNNTVVIACTELSIALENINSGIYDMARIQIKQAVKDFMH